MIKHLLIENLILIESEKILFTEGLNILSGETGSGKSAIIHALNLLSGTKTDVGLIRRGASKCVVEGSFNISKLTSLKEYLRKEGLEQEMDEPLLIRREVYQSGKSRCLINHQLVQSSFLKSLSQFLFHLTSQHASHQLANIETHKKMVDVYGNHLSIVKELGHHWEKEQNLRKKLRQLIETEAQRYRESEILLKEITEIEEARLKENEEEELFEEYTLLVNSEERAKHSTDLINLLSDNDNSLLDQIKIAKNQLEQLTRLDPDMITSLKSLENIRLEMEEVNYTLRQYSSHIEYQPEKVNEINERLSLINSLKKRYGRSIPEIYEYLAKAKEKLKELEGAEFLIENHQNELVHLEGLNSELCQQISTHRIKAASLLQGEITKKIQSLNMPQAKFTIKITAQARNHTGDESIEFYFIPNSGENEISVRQGASGGEISRITLALQALLAGREEISTLIFDEIDANIGGETAKVIGETLKRIAQNHQILCITHFPQVAKYADHHLNISKKEENGRTFSKVKILAQQDRELELARMVGE